MTFKAKFYCVLINHRSGRPSLVGVRDLELNVAFALTLNLHDEHRVVLALGQCDGPRVPLRVGRTDAMVAGPSGVPDPSEDIATHIAEFDRMGFTPTEMIGKLALRH